MDVSVTITVGENYTEKLKTRLTHYDISHAELAREMGKQPSQLSRWFNKPTQPRLDSIQDIEVAIFRILDRRAKLRRKNNTL